MRNFWTSGCMALFCLLFSCRQPSPPLENPTVDTQIPNAASLAKALWTNHLDRWYPKCIDSVAGGYYSNLDSAFALTNQQDKMIVSQSRHIWTCSQVALHFHKPEYLAYAAHGFKFLQRIWDSGNGGFSQDFNRMGVPIKNKNHKTAYGNAFAIYGLAAYYAASKDSNALKLAVKTFQWLESGAHDSHHGGYFQDLDSTGKPLTRTSVKRSNETIGYKDYNSSIHLLEAFTSLYHVWPDSLLKKRLHEMYTLVKDTMIGEKGYLSMYFTPDWKHLRVSGSSKEEILKQAHMDHVSFGHDIETAFLLLEAAEALGLDDKENLMMEMRRVTDISLNGYDNQHGGLYDEGMYFDTAKPIEIITNSKVWWAQAEALNTLDIMARHFPDGPYPKLLEQQWNYVTKYIIDSTHGGWYQFGLDTRPQSSGYPKGSIWKVTYHDGRALMEMIRRRKTGAIF